MRRPNFQQQKTHREVCGDASFALANASMATSESPLVRVWTAARPNQVAESCLPG